jgi:hypothetical protein
MPIINLDDLTAGHVTEADYFSTKGQLLISKGEIITEQHLALLRRRNIFEIQLHYQDMQQATALDVTIVLLPTPPLPTNGYRWKNGR